MTKLTVALARKAIRWNRKVDQKIDLDEAGKAIVCTAYGWMYYDTSGTYGFNLADCDYDKPDNIGYLKYILNTIEPNPDEQ
jgi:hypothetical protein